MKAWFMVYVLESGEYDDAHIVGVFSTLSKAQAYFPKAKWKRDDRFDVPVWEGGRRAGTITEWKVDA